MIIKDIYKQLRLYLRDRIILSGKRQRLNNRNVTIISSDCTGGMVYKELGMEFKSPTINMFFNAGDFITFCRDISYWIDRPMIEVEDDAPYPVAELGEGGIRLHLVHYKSVEEAQEKWNVRKKRIDFNNLFFVMNDRNDCSYEVMKEYDELPFANKVLFTHVPYEELRSSFCIKGHEDEEFVPVMTHFKNKISIARNIDQFDFVEWLNKRK
ncbi:DUF1919 domain-containing protein [Butyrivibrio sp. XB500-5]|uniref:DUF1919 domain-containing protein n=1 Tax=Butyrivibrio sp. XB500-5 TaxID=2364880 RepID=UPI000EAA4520|nr:DUF1919 domain-containing protein [Butyrivibrio sp. XB500-5]RKM60701.1 DUF1919 domain-containing protein [Butyrivibrio sp. XB500-5]